MRDFKMNSLRPRDAWQRLRLLVCMNLTVTLVLFACVGPPTPNGWQLTNGPVVPHDTFPADCSLCHSTGSWTEMRDDFSFDHGVETGVTLVGAHDDAECLRCHNDRGPVERFASRGCAGCHEDFHQGGLGPRCVACHVETGWRPEGVVAEHLGTRFPLVGAHAATACQECHPGSESGVYSPTPLDCEACHQADLVSATDPNHVALGWVQSCERCHKPTSWDGEGFVHSAWPLTGAHATADCDACHVSGVFLGTPRDCFACHAAEYQATTNPNHVANNFPMNCEECHSTSSWFGATFNHAGITSGCVTCHLPEFQAVTSPNHVNLGFPTDCEYCHVSTNTWQQINFQHTFNILGGAHGGIPCSVCHQGGPPNPPDCLQCHGPVTTGKQHQGVSGYVWSSPACIGCHPTGANKF